MNFMANSECRRTHTKVDFLCMHFLQDATINCFPHFLALPRLRPYKRHLRHPLSHFCCKTGILWEPRKKLQNFCKLKWWLAGAEEVRKRGKQSSDPRKSTLNCAGTNWSCVTRFCCWVWKSDVFLLCAEFRLTAVVFGSRSAMSIFCIHFVVMCIELSSHAIGWHFSRSRKTGYSGGRYARANTAIVVKLTPGICMEYLLQDGSYYAW